MSFCLNPACPKPDNPESNQYCHGCGSKLSESSQNYIFEHYRLIKSIGKGGFGRTYLAEDLDLFNQKVVIKRLLPTVVSNSKIQELSYREAKQLFELNHPQIPKLYRYLFKDNGYYLIQEFIEGENLLTEVKSLGRFCEEEIKEILLALVPVLAYIQTKDILHRDIKPQNILRRNSDRQLILIDFGAGRIKTTRDPSLLTAIYTPGYASREQMNGRAVKASDVYSLGVTCIRLLTGCLSLGTTDLIYDDYENKWRWREYLKEKNISIEPRLGRILDKMVADSLKERYQDANQVMEDLLFLKLPVTGIVTKPQLSILPGQTISRQNFLKWSTFTGGAIASLLMVNLLDNFLTIGLKVIPIPSKSQIREFSFETVTLDSVGQIINKENKSARYQTLDLGKGITMDLVFIPSGRFLMGSPDTEKGRASDEDPRRWLHIPAFWMGKYQVTQAQWRAIMGDNPSKFKGENRPVERVSWKDCIYFCQKLSKKTRKNLSLPSEAQWEYACRAGTTTPFYFGETINAMVVNYNGTRTFANELKTTFRKETTEVGLFPPNAFGLYDLHGNVWEWCLDTWYDNYKHAPTDGTALLEYDSDYAVFRGGSWDSDPEFCRSANRGRYDPGGSSNLNGFRIVLN